MLINSARLYTAAHDIDDPMLTGVRRPIVVGDYVWIIQQVTILPGVKVHDRAVLATSSVVTKDVPENAVVAGNPARQIGSRNPDVGLQYVPAAPHWRADEPIDN